MKLRVKWFITGNITELNEDDAILGPQTTMLELKGLLQIRYSYPAKDILIIMGKLQENSVRLRDIGLITSADSMSKVLTIHVVQSGGGLESANLGDDDENEGDDDEDIQEFTHEDMALAMRMLGKEVPVTPERLQELRSAPPRSRPAFLNASDPAAAKSGPTSSTPAAGGPPPATAASNKDDEGYTPKSTAIHGIFKRMEYGMRSIEAEDNYGITFPGEADPYQYWDLRLPENLTYQETYCDGNMFEVCLELFFFGRFEPLKASKDGERFNALVKQLLQSKLGIKARTPVMPREAGCMYPLLAVAVVMTETEATELGTAVFEDFGKPQEGAMQIPEHETGAGPAKPTGGCGQQ